MHIFKYIVKFLVVLGALDLGIMGAFNYDVIGHVFGGMMMPPTDMYTMGPRVAMVIIGLAGLLSLICLLKHCCCKDGNKKDKHGGGCCR